MASTPSTSAQTPEPRLSNGTADRILLYIRYANPIILLVIFLLAFTLHSVFTASNTDALEASSTLSGPGGKPLPKKTQPKGKANETSLDFSRPRKLLFNWLSLIAASTFVANAVNVIVHSLVKRDEGWWCGKATVIYITGSFFVYALFLISLIDTKPSPTSVHLATWIVAFILEMLLLGSSLAIYTDKHREPQVGNPHGGRLRRNMTDWEVAEILIDIVRIFVLLALIVFYNVFVALLHAKERRIAQEVADDEEITALLAQAASSTDDLVANGTANGRPDGYGTAATGGKHKHTEGAPPGWERPATMPSRSWWDYLKGYSLFFPYLWPSRDLKLKIIVIICFALVIIQRGLNLLVPIQVGRITDILAGGDGPVRMPWWPICVYILYRILQGTNGLVGAARSALWIPVSQYSYRELSVAAFEHVHGLSLDFHLGKKTGEVLSALGKGSSINTFLEQVTFQVLPMLVDLVVAIAYFLTVFDAYYALVVSVVTFWYIYLTIRMAQWRQEIRRQMVNADREEDAVKNDSMVSYETVKYFNAEAYEFNRYREAVNTYQRAEYQVLFSLNLMNVTQNLVFMLGLLIVCFLAAYQVTTGVLRVGRFVSLLTYMAQLQAPLNFFGTFYRMIQSAMINSERMLELFKEQPTVVDGPNARPLASCEGEVRFNDVHFAYDARKPALQGVSFRCAPGTTTALVGESGGGKSTVFRLLFRFYNSQEGSIQVDGHDVQDITIDSLRRHIGVVPQDTVLFNETVMYNLKYANPEASDEEVHDACRAASIHDKILTFPDGYNTRVGERGLRLSGGEKQRVAIARTILKNPRIILLDEATAALDTETEQHIQEALDALGHGRTMLVIAHRLSTITTADQILVLHDGKVAEEGTHDELLATKGRYASMWKKQVRAQRAAEEAKVLKDKAERLRSEVADGMEGSASQSEDEGTTKTPVTAEESTKP